MNLGNSPMNQRGLGNNISQNMGSGGGGGGDFRTNMKDILQMKFLNESDKYDRNREDSLHDAAITRNRANSDAYAERQRTSLGPQTMNTNVRSNNYSVSPKGVATIRQNKMLNLNKG
jgi:hypothetical protein